VVPGGDDLSMPALKPDDEYLGITGRGLAVRFGDRVPARVDPLVNILDLNMTRRPDLARVGNCDD
jgi:hypothetical protein